MTSFFGFFNNIRYKILIMQRILFIVFFIIVMTGCSEVFQPDIENVDSFLVIEGYITTQPGKHTVFLSYSRSYSDRTYFSGVTGADVNVIDENGNQVHYYHSGNGVYTANITDDNAAKIGSAYYLEVVTEDGAVFRSTPQLVVPSSEVKRLSCKYDRRTLLTEDAYGDAIEQEFSVMVLNIETNGILSSDNYYLYGYEAYLQCHNFFRDGRGMIYDEFHHALLSTYYSRNIHTVNADEFGNFQVRNDELMYITLNDLRDYDPFNPDSAELDEKRFEGLLIKLSQSSLSPDAYSFYRDAEEQLEAEGRLFDPSYTQLIGNIECVSEVKQEVLGVFYAADVSDYHAYLYINESNESYSIEIDSFPEFLFDTCTGIMPEDWIRPPI